MRFPAWLWLVLAGTVLVLAGGRAVIWVGGGVGGIVILVVGIGLLIAGEVIRQRRERRDRREREAQQQGRPRR